MASNLDISKVAQLQSNGMFRLTCSFQANHDLREVWVELEEENCRAWEEAPNKADAWTRLLIFEMMHIGGEFQINAPVSLTLLQNLENFMEAFIKWFPDDLHPVTLVSEQIIDDRNAPTDDSAVVCFSGGLDAAFAAYRHLSGAAGHNTKNIRAALLAAGVDIPLSDEQAFQGARKNSLHMLNDLGIDKLHVIRTNYRDTFISHGISWGSMNHLAVIAGLASFLEPSGYRNLVVGSAEPYNALAIPWGSQPVTDPLLSQRQFRIYTEGHGFSRTEKADFVKNWHFGASHLRVCWENIQLEGKNCGHCEKCKRTILNFKACRADHLLKDCMPSIDLSSQEIRSIKLSTQSLRNEYSSLLQFCRDHNVTGPWVEDLDFILNFKHSALWHRCRKKRIYRKIYRIFFGRQDWELN